MNRFLTLGRPVVKYDSTVKVVVDGNSLVVQMSSDSGGGALAKIPPCSNVVPVTFIGINGQTYRSMNGLDGGSTADVDGAFDAAKTNILFVLEGSNSITPTAGTGLTAWQACKDYCQARLTAHPAWKIILMTTTPHLDGAYSTSQRNAVNANIDQHNALIRNNFRDAGAVSFTDIRYAGGPCDYPDYEVATFEMSNATSLGVLWSTTDNPGQHLHLSTFGGRLNMQLMALALKRLAR